MRHEPHSDAHGAWNASSWKCPAILYEFLLFPTPSPCSTIYPPIPGSSCNWAENAGVSATKKYSGTHSSFGSKGRDSTENIYGGGRGLIDAISMVWKFDSFPIVVLRSTENCRIHSCVRDLISWLEQLKGQCKKIVFSHCINKEGYYTSGWKLGTWFVNEKLNDFQNNAYIKRFQQKVFLCQWYVWPYRVLYYLWFMSP